MSAFLHSWNGTGRVMLRVVLFITGGGRIVSRSPCGLFHDVGARGPGTNLMGVCLLRAQLKFHISSFPHVSELLSAPADVWLLNPHNLPPAGNDWGYWLAVQRAHRLDLDVINPWLYVDIYLSEIPKHSMTWWRHLRTVDGSFPLETNVCLTSFLSAWNHDQMENEDSSKHINQWFVSPVSFSLLNHMVLAPNPVPLQYVSTATTGEPSKDQNSLDKRFLLYFF